jgi:hypothetical protein
MGAGNAYSGLYAVIASGDAREDFDRVELHFGVAAGLVPATPNIERQSGDNRGGRDKPGHDPVEVPGAST